MFVPQEVPKLENLHFHFQVFSGWDTSWGQKLILKAVFNQVQYIIILYLFWKVLSQIRRVKRISHCISKCDLTGVGFFFFAKQNLKTPNTPKYAVTCRKLKSEKCPITPGYPPSYRLISYNYPGSLGFHGFPVHVSWYFCKFVDRRSRVF